MFLNELPSLRSAAVVIRAKSRMKKRRRAVLCKRQVIAQVGKRAPFPVPPLKNYGRETRNSGM